jgi:anti-sigma factor RsiW
MSMTHEDRSEIEDLLPWHAAGTLGAAEAQRVEAALAADPELARRYALVREELTQTIALNEALGAPSPRALDTLLAKIDAEPARRPIQSDPLARIGAFFASLAPRTLAWGAAAAALVLLLQAGVIGGFVLKEKTPGAGYQTASEASKPAEEGANVFIRFAPQATAAAITQFLRANKLTIGGGPSAGGLYLVRVAPSKLPPADLQHLVDRLQQDKVVGFIVQSE